MLVEREAELALCHALLEESRTAGRLLLLQGPEGSGKTAVVEELRAMLPPEVTVLGGHCHPVRSEAVLWPFAEMLAARGADPGVLDSLFAVTGWVAAELTGGGGGGVLVLEDLQWADEPTCDALRVLARRLDALRVLVVATFRGDEVDLGSPFGAALGDLGRAAGLRRHELAPLSPAGVAELVRDVGLTPSCVVEATGGNPGLVALMCQGLGASGVEDVVAARVAVLPRADRFLVELVACSDRAVPIALLDLVVPDWQASLHRCRHLVMAGVDGVQFRHGLVQSVVTARVAPSTRARILRILARAGELAAATDHLGLTARQYEVLQLLREGCTDREIADRLCLSQKTVGHHVVAILGRLGVTNRREAARLLARGPAVPQPRSPRTPVSP